MKTLTAAPEVEMDEKVEELLQLQPENCTIVHCRLSATEEVLIRIWPQTFLIQDNGNRKKLIKALGIPLMPQWDIRSPSNGFVRFTLLFEGLDKSCSHFQLLEDIPQAGGFYSPTIQRNKTDVYDTVIMSDES